MNLKQRKLNAMSYLATLPNYKISHYKSYVTLEHWGRYGWCAGSRYCEWKTIETVYYYEPEQENL